MPLQAISHAVLMRESETRLEDAARAGNGVEQLVAGRILSDVNLWRQWESEHHTLLQPVAEVGRPEQQGMALRSGVLGLIHRKALFEYLRATGLRGAGRERLVSYFHGSLTYTDAMVSEHGQYLRSAGSHLCARHLGVAILLDGVFQGPVARYEELYMEYFHAFCGNLLAESDGRGEPSQAALLPYLKHEVTRLRTAILRLPRTAPELMYEESMRRPTGDTQKLRRPR